MDLKKEALKFHKDNVGKIAMICKAPVNSMEDLSLAYSPGVAEPCLEIHKDINTVYDYTAKSNMVAVISNGTAVLGLGNLGASASIPVMEGKAILFKLFGGIDAFPICLDTEDPEEIIKTVKLLTSTLGAINLEDIKAPECFIIEKKLKESLDIPVFHDDQHGTAVVVLAGLINSLKLVNKDIKTAKIILNGPGSAGIAITKLLLKSGATNLIMCDRSGAMYDGRKGKNPNEYKDEIAKITNLNKEDGTLEDVLKGADVFIGVSAANIVSEEMVSSMNSDAIVFALANPTPEIMPEKALKAGAKVVCTGRSDFPNQVNNVLAFPGIFRGALDVRASEINDEMKIAAAYAIAELISEDELKSEYVIADTFDKRIAPMVAMRVAECAIKCGVARNKEVTPQMVYDNAVKLLSK